MSRESSGFTLIELLAVIAIISGLASSILASVNGARAKARDVRRSADVRQIVNALQLYELDHGNFPCSSGQNSLSSTFLQTLISGKYLSSMPVDPLNTAAHYYYYRTFKERVGGPCGKIVHMSLDYEISGACPFGKLTGAILLHCHAMYPNGLPNPPCADPYLITSEGVSDGLCVGGSLGD